MHEWKGRKYLLLGWNDDGWGEFYVPYKCQYGAVDLIVWIDLIDEKPF